MFIRYRPGAPLDSAIECVWLSRRDQAWLDCEHMLPSGKAQLVIPLHEAPIQWAAAEHASDWKSWTCGIVHGPQSRYYLAGPKPTGTVIGASFRPGMAAAILGASMEELRDAHVTLEELWGRRWLSIHDRLASAATPKETLRLFESELIARIHRPLLIHPAIAQALQTNVARIEDIQRSAGYSAKHFIQLFRSSVGLAPKHYYRVQRFSRALSMIARGGETLADVAADMGYSDQSHLSREFRELAGVSPSAYRPRAVDSEHHHVVARAR